MNKLDRCGQFDVVIAAIAAQMRRRQRQHRAHALAARFHEMGGDFRDARRMFRRHTRTDQRIDRVHIRAQIGSQSVMRFAAHFIHR